MTTGRKDFYTRFSAVLADVRDYNNFKNEMHMLAVDEIFYNDFAGRETFEAIVLPDDLNNSSKVTTVGNDNGVIRIRPLDIHNFILPEPCEYGHDKDKVAKILQMHPTAFLETAEDRVLSDQQKAAKSITFGQVVTCRINKGPLNQGCLREITYNPFSKRIPSTTKGINLSCINLNINPTLSQNFNNAKRLRNKAVDDFEKENCKMTAKPPTCKTDFNEEHKKTPKTWPAIARWYSGPKSSLPVKVYNGTLHATHSFLLGTPNGSTMVGVPPRPIHGRSDILMHQDVIMDFINLNKYFNEWHKEAYPNLPAKKEHHRYIRLSGGGAYRSHAHNAKLWDQKHYEARALGDPSVKGSKARSKQSEAAMPGTGFHGWGLAFDMLMTDPFGVGSKGGQTGYDSPYWLLFWKEAYLQNRWDSPKWYKPTGWEDNKFEPWHFQHVSLKEPNHWTNRKKK